MTWKERLDNLWKGLVVGVLFPAILFFFYWMFFQHQLNFPRGFLRYLIHGQMLSNVIKLCGLGNLLLFYLSLNQKMDKFSKGIIVSVLLYVLLVAYITFYMEPELL